jgi:hypothetical protein
VKNTLRHETKLFINQSLDNCLDAFSSFGINLKNFDDEKVFFFFFFLKVEKKKKKKKRFFENS